MKKTMKFNVWSLLILAGIGGFLFSSCSDDDDDDAKSSISAEEAERNEYFSYIPLDVEVVEETTFNVLDEMEKRIKSYSGTNSEEEKSILNYYKMKYDQLKDFAKHAADSIAAVNPGNSLEAITGQVLEMGRCTLTYTDLGADGKYRKMSVLLVFPTRFSFNINAKQIILGCHYTITSNHERPTNTDFQGMSDACLLGAEWATTNNYFVVIPDYEGYGASVEATHPYLNREVQARQCLKALIVASEWFMGSHGEKFDSRNVVVEGYSQGGAVAAATYRYWLEHCNELWAKTMTTPLIGAVCGDGPYDPYATLQYYCSQNRLTMPAAPALMLYGLCKTDPDAIKAGLEVKDFVTNAFLVSGIIDRIASKLYTTDGCYEALKELNKNYPGAFRFNEDGSLPTDQALNKETFQYFLNGTEPSNNPELREKLKVLKYCLQKNGLCHNFTPADHYDFTWKSPLGDEANITFRMTPHFSFFHGTHDTVVPYENINSVYENWGPGKIRVTRCINPNDHTDLGQAFFIEMHNVLVQQIFRGEWNPGYYSYDSNLLSIFH